MPCFSMLFDWALEVSTQLGVKCVIVACPGHSHLLYVKNCSEITVYAYIGNWPRVDKCQWHYPSLIKFLAQNHLRVDVVFDVYYEDSPLVKLEEKCLEKWLETLDHHMRGTLFVSTIKTRLNS